ncbi:type II toxin-antitoxin system HicA family toxin [Methylovulum miyakonense]|uniref:type II toxin-antitoxin system HicA family toxin n=1 Tax=Methylovulum miyakonense TaxID=645578 RepID=UPI000369375C|nr:type II toxin-antitoxin system HicA family toxin [Methylovulum miyakonense]
MKSISGKAFAKLIEKRGWRLVRINGSHHVYMQTGNPIRLSIPVHGNEDLKIGLLKHFMKVVGIVEEDF